MKKSVLGTIVLATILVLSGLMSAYVIVPESVDARDVKPKQELDFDEDVSMYRGMFDATTSEDSYMLWDDWGGSWCDAEKLPGSDGEGNPPPDNPGDEDDLMCWAAAASNVLEWTGWGLSSGMSNTDQMFQHFQDHWYDDGSLPEYAWHWWFDGTETVPGPDWSYVDVSGGGSFWPTYTFTDFYDEQWTESQTLAAIDTFLHDGYGVTLAIYTDAGGGHAITCWGFNYDSADPDYYVGIWVTDSDDDKHLTSPPDSLRYYEVAYNSGESRWHLQNLYGSNNWYIGGVNALRARPPTIIVPDDYPTIQQAIDAALAGDTIYVRAGTYYENVVVNKQLSITGAGAEVTIVEASDPNDHVFYVTVNNVTISGFTVKDATGPGKAGVYLYYSNHSRIENNSASNNYYGIVFYSSSNSTVSGNTITNNVYGVRIFSSSSNTFYHNNFVDNTQQVYIATPGYANFWNSSYPSGGNYWSNYTGVDLYSGPNQDEAGSDGIGDTPHVLDAWNQDNYPYMNLWGPIHNINTTLNYWAIQEAIDAFETLDGHTIQVDAGTYIENMDVTKQLSITGAGAEVTIVEASDPNDHVFYVTVNNVTISGFTVKDATGPGKAGVYLYYSNHSRIENNSASNNVIGIDLHNSSNNIISGNNITANGGGIDITESYYNSISGNNITANSHPGIRLESSSSNTISGNNIAEKNLNGIVLWWSCSNNIISGNNITANRRLGIELESSSSNSISGNYIANSLYGISIANSLNNLISGNIITNHEESGLSLWVISYSNISGNNITNNLYGVALWESSECIISENSIANNGEGFNLWQTYNNFIYHNNLVDNIDQVYSESSMNVWDNGYPSGGNYWSNYTDVDLDHDGIGDTPHVIDVNNQDNYPLMNPWSPIMGDVNADGIVDIFDIGFISAHWYPGPPIGPLGYNAIADINNDLAVDIFDIGICSAHWGQTW